MRGLGLIGLLLTVAIVGMLTMKKAKAPVEVPVAVPGVGNQTVVVPANQAVSQVGASVNGMMDRQAEQMQQATQQAISGGQPEERKP